MAHMEVEVDDRSDPRYRALHDFVMIGDILTGDLSAMFSDFKKFEQDRSKKYIFQAAKIDSKTNKFPYATGTALYHALRTLFFLEGLVADREKMGRIAVTRHIEPSDLSVGIIALRNRSFWIALWLLPFVSNRNIRSENVASACCDLMQRRSVKKSTRAMHILDRFLLYLGDAIEFDGGEVGADDTLPSTKIAPSESAGVPTTAPKVLRSWKEIAVAANASNSPAWRSWVKKAPDCPIQIGRGKGRRPFVRGDIFVRWLMTLHERLDKQRQRYEDTRATTQESYHYGKRAEVIPDLKGHVVTRRRHS